MRLQTVNSITLYEAIGAAVNIVALWIALNLDIQPVEQIIMVACVNVAYILISRDVARKQEQLTCKRMDRVLYGKHRPQ